jgi:hypothetical protein
MIDSGSFPAALRGPRRYQFQGALDPTLQSREGVVTFGAFLQDYFAGLSLDSITVGTTTTQEIHVSTFAAPGDPKFKVGWIVYLWAGLQGSPNYMLARITAYDDADPEDVKMTFEAYQAAGSGTFDYWTIVPQFENAYNYIQNTNYSGFDVSNRSIYSTSGRAFFDWPKYGTTTNVVETDTNLLKAGYSLYEYKGEVTVYEDEYDINRPYIGKTTGSSQTLTTTTTTTTYDYFTDPPTVTTETTSTTEKKSYSHTFGAEDFDPDAPEYVAGGPAVYADGVLVSWPNSSHMTKKTAKLGEFKTIEYIHSYQSTPGNPGVYRPTVFIDISRTLSDIVFDPTTPSDFFNGL